MIASYSFMGVSLSAVMNPKAIGPRSVSVETLLPEGYAQRRTRAL